MPTQQRRLALEYNAKNQTTKVNGTAMSYADADQTRRVDAGTKHFTYSQLGLGTEKQASASGPTAFTRDNEGTLVSMREPAGTSYYLLDGLTSVVAVTNAAGDVAKRYEYEPYGQAIATTGSHANPWRFASGYLDAGSSFYKFGTRYYVPSLARWTQHDPTAASSRTRRR